MSTLIRTVLFWAMLYVVKYVVLTGLLAMLAYITAVEVLETDWLAVPYGVTGSLVAAWWWTELRDDIRYLRIRARAVRIARAARSTRPSGFPSTYQGWS